MNRAPAAFVALGSGAAGGHGAGNKGALLDRAAAAGLAVPRGILLLDEAWTGALRAGLVDVEAGAVCAAEPGRLIEWLKLPKLAPRVAVRSAFSAEDRPDQSLAGFFSSRLFVDATDPVKLAAALTEVWGSALRQPGAFRRDVLIMAMVAAQTAGVAFSEREYEDDLVNFTTGTSEGLVAGAVAGETLMLPKLRRWERRLAGLTAPPWSLRLQQLLHDIRGTLGDRDWDIEWADDGRRCWLVQVRPITRPPRRNEFFTGANLREILPDPPSHFTASLVTDCAADVFSYYRRFDAKLPTARTFVELFAGRPAFNLSLLGDLMRCWGLPTCLVTGNLGGAIDHAYGLNPGRALRKTPVLLRQALAQLRSVGSARSARRAMLVRSRRPGETYTSCVVTLRWLFTTLLFEMLGLTAGMSGPLLVLRRMGVLAEHSARQQTRATAMYAALDDLRSLAAAHTTWQPTLAAGGVPSEPLFEAPWQAFLERYGHRGVYETDIARPRFREEPETLLRTLVGATPSRLPAPPRSLRGSFTWPLWWQAARTMGAREELRSTAMVALECVRIALLGLADASVARGQLPERDALWQLTVDEVCRLDEGWQPGAAFFVERRATLARERAIRVPNLVRRFDDLESAGGVAGTAAAQQRFAGVSLTSGTARGRAWVLMEPSTTLPEGFAPASTILVAPAVEAGWIPTFALVAGVVVEIGGDLSHGSIILREVGVPAITNVDGVTGQIVTGDVLNLRAGQGIVERVQPPARAT